MVALQSRTGLVYVAKVISVDALNVPNNARVGIILGQCPETAIAHMACFKSGKISIPLFNLFGTDALFYRRGATATWQRAWQGPAVPPHARLPGLPLLRVARAHHGLLQRVVTGWLLGRLARR